MSAPNKHTGKAPLQRPNLPRRRKSMRLEMRWTVYEQLLDMAGPGEPLVAAVERLVLTARPLRSTCE